MLLEEEKIQILKLITDGLTYNEIGKLFSKDSRTIGKIAAKAGFHRKPRVKKDLSTTICSRCGISFVQAKHKRTYCAKCLHKQVAKRRNNNFVYFIRDKLGHIKSHANINNIKYNLTIDYIIGLWESYKGLCFYTDIPMIWGAGKGTDKMTVSVDRIIPENGYTIGNVVLCGLRINIIKQDVSLSEMKDWMPGWFLKIQQYIK